MRVILGIACVLLVVVITAVLVDGNSVMAWAVAQQRAFQNEMAQAVRSLQMGAPGAWTCLLYTSPSPRDQRGSRMPSSA